jgi:3-oxoacyl-[acyl-carrier protein] reductase
MNTIDLQNRCAVVTGGAQGIGKSVAERLVYSGARVALWDNDIEKAEETASLLGKNVIAVQVDITDWTAVQHAYSQTCDSLEKVDILVNSGGIAGPNATLMDYPVDDWRRVIDVNLNGTFLTNKVLVADMQKRGYGRIVNIASVAGKEGNPNAAAYSASKAAVIGLTKSLGKELAGTNIAVNCVTPAAARTRIFDQMSEEHIQYMLSKIPRGRFLEVNEAAAMIAWLVSEENSFTTAAVFDLSGGRATY